jgi:hypothetical protein
MHKFIFFCSHLFLIHHQIEIIAEIKQEGKENFLRKYTENKKQKP